MSSRRVGPEYINVAILGIGNHRVPSYELPSNIPGLTFPNPITTAQGLAPGLAADNDVVIALTHIGFTDEPGERRDRQQRRHLLRHPGGGRGRRHRRSQPHQPVHRVRGLQVPAGDPGRAEQRGGAGHPGLPLQHLPGRGVLGLLPEDGQRRPGGRAYEVVSKAGRYIAITTATFAEDPTIKALITPYQNLITAYNDTVLGDTRCRSTPWRPSPRRPTRPTCRPTPRWPNWRATASRWTSTSRAP